MRDITNDYPLSNYNFLLRVDGKYDLPCKRVHSFQEEKEYEYIQEGGRNDSVHIRRKPATKPKTFKVERYVGQSGSDPLVLGMQFKLPIKLLVSRHPGEFDNPKRTYMFFDCVVIAKEFGELTAESAGILTENVTIAYDEMLCLDNAAEKTEATWEFDGTNSKGKGNKKARKVQDYGIIDTKKEKRTWPEKSSARNIKNYL